MKVKEIAFKDIGYGCENVFIGSLCIGSFNPRMTKDQKPYNLKLNLPGIKDCIEVDDKEEALKIVEKAVLASVKKLIEIEV